MNFNLLMQNNNSKYYFATLFLPFFAKINLLLVKILWSIQINNDII